MKKNFTVIFFTRKFRGNPNRLAIYAHKLVKCRLKRSIVRGYRSFKNFRAATLFFGNLDLLPIKYMKVPFSHFVKGTPDWSIFDFERFPAVQWKLQNHNKLKNSNPEKHNSFVASFKKHCIGLHNSVKIRKIKAAS